MSNDSEVSQVSTSQEVTGEVVLENDKLGTAENSLSRDAVPQAVVPTEQQTHEAFFNRNGIRPSEMPAALMFDSRRAGWNDCYRWITALQSAAQTAEDRAAQLPCPEGKGKEQSPTSVEGEK